MTLFNGFVHINITPEMQGIAEQHALQRTQIIVRRFIPRNSPLSHLESNYIGVLGELAVCCYFGKNMILKDNYDQHFVDSGDICIKNLMYDIKSEAVPNKFYRKLYYGDIKPYEPYGCRVWTACHKHHLNKYTGGIIFVALPIPNDARNDKQTGLLRSRIVEHVKQAIIIGYVNRKRFKTMKPELYSPKDPGTGKKRMYNSPNFIFHHSEVIPIEKLK